MDSTRASLGITLPNESPEEAFSLGCDMIVDAAGLSCSQAVLDMLYALLGYATKGYEKTFAVRQFSGELAGRVCDTYSRGKGGMGPNRVNAYMGVSPRGA